MSDQLRVGITFEKAMAVTEAVAARHLAGKSVQVLSTPEMVRLIEECALEGVLPFLQPSQNTVGTRVEVRHLAATPVGMKVAARCTLVEIDRRQLGFMVEVHDELERVGEGTHERFIVDAGKHQQRIAEKLARWKQSA
jgi:fluoroacetyl-CoA thioesterase